MSTPPVNPTLTSAKVPQAQPQPQNPAAAAAVAAVPRMQIVAKPLSDPEFLGLRPKNSMHQLYWANRGHQNGIRVNYRHAQGFRMAKKEDLIECPDFMVDVTGQLIYGDLVLMLIGKAEYQGALLHNHNKAIRRVNKFGAFETNETGQPIDVMKATLDETRASAGQKAKIRPFTPGSSELSALMDQASAPEKP